MRHNSDKHIVLVLALFTASCAYGVEKSDIAQSICDLAMLVQVVQIDQDEQETEWNHPQWALPLCVPALAELTDVLRRLDTAKTEKSDLDDAQLNLDGCCNELRKRVYHDQKYKEHLGIYYQSIKAKPIVDRTCPPVTNPFHFLKSMQEVRNLTIDAYNLRPADLAGLSEIPIRNLIIQNIKQPFMLPVLNNTQAITINRCTLAEDTFKKLADAKELSSLSIELCTGPIVLPENTKQLEKLEVFAIIRCPQADFDTILKQISQVPSLTDIRLPQNQLLTFPELNFTGGKPGRTISLHLANNMLETTALRNIWRIKELSLCDLSGNLANNFPALDGGEVSMKTLILDNIDLRSDSIINVCNLTSLEVLYMRRTGDAPWHMRGLSYLPEQIKNLKNLKMLYLDGNSDLGSLPGNLLEKLPNLTTLTGMPYDQQREDTLSERKRAQNISHLF